MLTLNDVTFHMLWNSTLLMLWQALLLKCTSCEVTEMRSIGRYPGTWQTVQLDRGQNKLTVRHTFARVVTVVLGNNKPMQWSGAEKQSNYGINSWVQSIMWESLREVLGEDCWVRYYFQRNRRNLAWPYRWSASSFCTCRVGRFIVDQGLWWFGSVMKYAHKELSDLGCRQPSSSDFCNFCFVVYFMFFWNELTHSCSLSLPASPYTSPVSTVILGPGLPQFLQYLSLHMWQMAARYCIRSPDAKFKHLIPVP